MFVVVVAARRVKQLSLRVPGGEGEEGRGGGFLNWADFRETVSEKAREDSEVVIDAGDLGKGEGGRGGRKDGRTTQVRMDFSQCVGSLRRLASTRAPFVLCTDTRDDTHHCTHRYSVELIPPFVHS